MNSKPFALDWKDLGKGLFLALTVALVGGIQQMLSSHGFDFASYDWGYVVNLVFVAFTGYMTKQFVSDTQGTPFGSNK